MLEDFKNLRNKYIQYNLGNDTVYIRYRDTNFIYGIYNGCFVLWDNNSRHLDEFDLGKGYKEIIPTKEFIEWLDKTLKNYFKGIVKCSDCGKEIKKEDIAGRYFAGMYCKDCWEREWKEKEEHETYD